MAKTKDWIDDALAPDEKAAPPAPVAYYDFYKTGKPTSEFATRFDGASLTRQEFAEDCDINVLMKRYENHDIGAIMRDTREPLYVDWNDMPQDLMDALERAQQAEDAFMTLPARVRREFDNNAVAFVDYASDPGNLDQMREWGLAPPATSPTSLPPPAAAGGGSAPSLGAPHSSPLDVTVRSDTKPEKGSKNEAS